MRRDTLPAVDDVELTASGLLLRPWQPDDASAVLAVLTDPSIVQWEGQGVRDLERPAEWIRRRADLSCGTRMSLAVTDETSGALLGCVALHQIHDGDASIGYWTAAAARGRGVASRAVSALSGDWPRTWPDAARRSPGQPRVESGGLP